MTALAGLAVSKGYKVSGQDKNYFPPMSSKLEELNIIPNKTVGVIDDINNCDLVIVGNSQSRGDPSVEHILENNIKYISGPEWLKKNILADKFVIAVSGTHGKTTLSSMLVKILNDADYEPGYLIGGIELENNSCFKYTDSKYFIIEADEYDTAFFDKRSKFVHFDPDILIINNIEFDHADIFSDIESIKFQFHSLIRTMPNNSTIIYNPADREIDDVLNKGCWSKKKPFTINKDINLSILGKHNLDNASAAYCVSKEINIKEDIIYKAIKNFKGVKRRLEVIKEQDYIVIDDFAHHPSAIKSGISSIKNSYKGKHIKCIFEIRSNSMIAGAHKDNFIESFKGVDDLYLVCSRNIDWLDKDLEKNFYTNIEDVLNKITIDLTSNDLIVLMSNGDSSIFRKKFQDI